MIPNQAINVLFAQKLPSPRTHSANQWINRQITLFLSFCWRKTLRSTSDFQLEYFAILNCKFHGKNTSVNFRLQFENTFIREIDDYSGEKACAKQQLRRYIIEWFLDWLGVFVRLVVIGQIGRWLLDLWGAVFSFFSALSSCQFCLQSQQSQIIRWETLLAFNFQSPKQFLLELMDPGSFQKKR